MVADLGHHGYLGCLRHDYNGYMFAIVTMITMVAFVTMVTMFILAEKTCGTLPPGCGGDPPLGQVS
jgi:hypothetical protein